MYWSPLIFNSQYSNQLSYGSFNLKHVNIRRFRNLGYSKEWKLYITRKIGGLVRKTFPTRLSQRHFSSNSNIINNSCVCLKELIKDNSNLNHLNKKLIHIVSNPEVLILSYEIIKSKPGNSTSGSDNITLNKIDLTWF